MSEPLHSLCVLKYSPGAVRRLNASKEDSVSENKFEIQPGKEKQKWYKKIWGIIAGIAKYKLK